MLTKALLTKVIGSRNDRIIKRLKKKVQKINELELEFEKLSDEQLQDKTNKFKAQVAQGTKLDDILVEAFAVVREASKRILEMRHYDVQLIGGMVLHMGKIAEMRTGEGKTLVATLAVYLNALTSKGVHVVTVNDYLASRDAELMGKLYRFLGLTTGVIVSGLTTEEKKEAYACDVTYGTNNEFGFDYLRDNMAFSVDDKVQRSRNFVVIDEVDSILIDEARTPLIISGAAEDSSEFYLLFNRLVQKLEPSVEEDGQDGDYALDEKSKQAHLTEKGHAKIEQWLIEEGILQEGENLYSPQHVTKMYYLNAALRANTLYQQNVDYMIVKNEVVIVDEHTGRAMPGRRWSDGLHQAMEAKEGVKIQAENQTLASITFQNFFRLYDKISGMTGTADTEAAEFHEIYSLEVIVIPTHKPPRRDDRNDLIYASQKDKFEAIIKDIQKRTAKGQPILVGTASIETSEILSTMMRKKKIAHNVLNAKQHEREAKIIAQAGQPGNVTIATNMAGRGTDIILGGNWQEEINELEEPMELDVARIKEAWKERHQAVIDAGGLCIIGSERHDSRRIDNQLRGRSGRQGDPGESVFYLSLDDHVLRIFMPPRMISMIKGMMKNQGEAIDGKMITKAIAKAQAKVEAYHFDMRKNVLEYDNVANEQRKVIYGQRDILLSSEDVTGVLKNMRHDVAENVFHSYIPKESIEEQWDVKGLQQAFESDFGLKLNIKQWLEEDESLHEETLKDKITKTLMGTYDEKIAKLDKAAVHQFEKVVLLQSLDNHWREHLSSLDHLRNSIHLRGYAQKDPKQEYKRESFELFSSMLDNFKYDVVSTLTKIHFEHPEEEVSQVEDQWRHSVDNLEFNHDEVQSIDEKVKSATNEQMPPPVAEPQQQSQAPQEQQQPFVRQERKISRNELCPCGSGKKYKHCHGALQ
ncbi:preprotein translocase subunit SecA [Thiotrichales bacterium 19S9-12]|nr:preprotein translocase subunit SecA [Thiotrichales bacterium 19S9-11]MCF6811120.1 preprotein translocase subunit SecA [Thiotrichales bacterium 19S9-12]